MKTVTATENLNNSEQSSKDFGEQHFLNSGSWNNPATPTTKILSTMWEGFFVFGKNSPRFKPWAGIMLLANNIFMKN
ncbi:MAG: hypothetical protein CVU07_06620 [Bacteroidetes bacterium HGW-Bacteroidetes-23]|nr:MAG: hypothetical protein CVU07_06620 [Bacteroidetes bacterium HGW-Bacteroidetes-23]